MTSPFKSFIGVVLGTKPSPPLREAPGPAEVRLAKIPDVVNTAAWYEEHAQLCYDLQVAAVRAASNQASEAEVAKAHSALLAHAAIINGGSSPVLLAKDGVHPIPFERLVSGATNVKKKRHKLRDQSGTKRTGMDAPAWA